MFCSIRWSDDPTTIRKEYFQKVNKTNLLQAYAYGLAMRDIKRQNPRLGVVEIDGQEAGIVQILENKALKGLLQAVILDRGPLWFEGFGNFEHFEAFLAAFRDHYPQRLGRAVRFIPEIQPSENIEKTLQKYGFKRKSKEYQTLIVDLTQTPETLRENLKKNWHGSLKKAEKSALKIDWDNQGLHLLWLMKFYDFDKKTKGYDGPPVELLNTLAKYFIPENGLLIGRALYEGRAIAAILIFCHGRGATYQIGWNTQEGRKYGAHNKLLWDAILLLKARGLTAFDLGGVNDTEAQNVKKFKEGLGGDLLSLPGIYT